MANRWGGGGEWKQTDFIFLCSKITVDGDCSHEIKNWLFLGRKAMTNLDSLLKSRDISVLKKVCRVKTMVLPVVMYGCELDHKGVWVPKKWCFQIVMLENTLESPWDCKIKPDNPKGNQPWLLIGRTVDEAEVPVLWPPDTKSQLIGKDPDAGKDWRQKEKEGNRGWCILCHVSIASCTPWKWIWANARRWWGQRSPACRSPGSQNVRDDLTTEQQQNEPQCVSSQLLLWPWLWTLIGSWFL